MRIIAGEYKGRMLDFPKNVDVRPTQDRVREALFNVIAPQIQGKLVLDLFAGSGSLGIEAISRGAKKATFVENNLKCIHIIKKNIEKVAIESKTAILKMDVFKALGTFDEKGDIFDIVFLDPPYYKELPKKALIMLSQYDILSPTNTIVIEHFKKDNIPENINNILIYNQKKYGDTVLSFFRKT